MRRSLVALFLLAGCAKDPVVPPSSSPILRLARAADGAIKVELQDGTIPVRALELELVAAGGGAVLIEDATGAPGVPLDTVRARMAGTNRAVLFAGDTRGVRVGTTGELMRFRARASSGGAADGTLTIERAVVVDGEGQTIAVELGGALPLR